MSVPARLAGFAVVLAVLFGAAALAGSAVGPVREPAKAGAKASDGMGMGGAHGESAATPAQPVRGLAVSDHGFTLKLARPTAQPGKRFDLAFRVVGRDGRTVRDFDVEHTKRMHFIVVRRDMTGFQHLHPTQAADGSWSVPVTLRDAGSYRVYADFSVDGKPQTLADDLTADGTVRSSALPAPVKSVDVDGLRVSLTQGAGHAGEESQLGFTVTRDGRPVAIQDYLGAMGHLVALRQGDLAFLHVHPDENSLRFMATFPTAGRYRLFLQFQTQGRVHTAAFTQEVSR
ncbi:MAG: hypothetical protein QOG11_98 [Solirubrobacteraceae bacterium]|nr:hypothetical protein [Solirubrobacteraceae bacterium]